MKLLIRIKQAKYYVAAILGIGVGYTAKQIITPFKTVEAATVRCVMGDMGRNDKAQAVTAKAMKDAGCEHLLMVGDLVYDVGIKSTNDPKFMTHFWNHYKDFKKVFVVMGNHDHYGNVTAWIDLAKKYDNLVYPSMSYLSVASDGFCIYAWDSEIIERGKDKNNLQAKYAKKASRHPKCKTLVAIAHHPYKSSGSHGDCSKDVCDFYEENIIGRFDYAFYGHDHHLEDAGEFEGTKMMLSGAGSELRTCKKNKGSTCWAKHGFIKIVDGKAEVVFVKVN